MGKMTINDRLNETIVIVKNGEEYLFNGRFYVPLPEYIHILQYESTKNSFLFVKRCENG